MKIIRKSRGTELAKQVSKGTKFPNQAQRVFLCYNKSNIKDIYNKDGNCIVADLLSMDAGMDCVVSYLENPNEIDEKELRNELSESGALVIFVTTEMLKSIENENLPVEYQIARELNIPILPISNADLKDKYFFETYKEAFGSIHCISRLDFEYRTKLKTQLEEFLVPEETKTEIRKKAFTAKIFLSYRKHELEDARNFMTKFHNLEGFETISIWYDNLLTSGTDFDKAIEEAISQTDAFVMAVTPDFIGDKAKYVQEIEYPFAKEKNKPIVAVELKPISQPEKFTDLFVEQRLISKENTTELQKTFRDKLGENVFVEQFDSERAYLLGIAYLRGIDVERDFERAIKLLSIATKEQTTSSIAAANELAGIYEDGKTTNINYNEALKWHNVALSVSEKVLGNEHPDTAKAYLDIAIIYYKNGDYSKALELNKKTLSIFEKALGKENLNTASTYNEIANIYNIQGNYSEAIEWFKKTMDIFENIFGKEHLYTVKTYNNTGLAYYYQGDYSKALEWYKKVLDVREKILGKENPDTAKAYDNIGLAYDGQGDYSQAIEWHKKALEVFEKNLGKKHPDTAKAYDNIAVTYSSQGDYSQAIEWHKKALEVFEKILGKEHLDTATTYNNIASTYSNQGDYSKAIEWYKKALKVFENGKKLGKKHPKTANIYNIIACIYDRQKDYPKAIEWYKKVLYTLDKEHPNTADIYSKIAVVYLNQGTYLEALEWNEKALYVFEKFLGKEHPKTANTYNTIAVVYNRQGDYSKALEWYKKALYVQEKLGKEHQNTAIAYRNVAGAYSNLRDYSKALEFYEKALPIFERVFGKEHPNTTVIHNNITAIKDSLYS